MKLTVFGASGGIGRQLVEQALAAGHEVVAVVRRPESLDLHPTGAGTSGDLAVRQADLARDVSLAPIVAGSDAVLSAVGPRPKEPLGVASNGTRRIVDAMTAAGVGRLIVISAGPVSTMNPPGVDGPKKQDPGDTAISRLILKPMLRSLLRKGYEDLARMESIVERSGLDWTIVRPPRLVDKPRTGRYRTAYDASVWRGYTIGRSDVADAMLKLVRDKESYGRAVGLGY